MERSEKIQINSRRGINFVNKEDIVQIVANGNYSDFKLSNNKKITIPKCLNVFEEQLETSGFIRIHRSYLINAQYLQGYFSQKNCVKLYNNQEIPVSRKYKKELIKFINSI